MIMQNITMIHKMMILKENSVFVLHMTTNILSCTGYLLKEQRRIESLTKNKQTNKKQNKKKRVDEDEQERAAGKIRKSRRIKLD